MAELAGKRALVTGGSGGIGAAIARELAARGAGLILAARRPTALDAIAAECKALGAATETVAVDLGRPGAAATLWERATKSGPIDVVVNNAGFGYFRPLGDVEAERDAELVQLNITSLVELSRRFVEHRRGLAGERAYLLNVASIAAYQSVPNMALYAASKAFVRNFTEALHDELRGTATSATCVCPGGTKTDFHAVAGAGDYGWIANRSMMSAEAVARASVRAMLRGRRTIIPGFANKLACWGVRLVPRAFASRVARWLLGKPRAGALPPRTGVAA
jgi:short-subunit dehydrogenase